MADVVRYSAVIDDANKTRVEIFQREIGKTQRYMYIPISSISLQAANQVCEIINNGGNIAISCSFDRATHKGEQQYYFKWKVVESLKKAEAKVFDEVFDYIHEAIQASKGNTAPQSVTAITNQQFNQKILDELQKVEYGDVIRIIRKKDGSKFEEYLVLGKVIGKQGWYIKVEVNKVSIGLHQDYWEEVLKKGDLEIQIIKKGQQATSTQTQAFKVGDRVKIRKDSEYYGDSDKNPKDIEGTIIEIVPKGNLNIRVEWDNNSKNSYASKDLELVKQTKGIIAIDAELERVVEVIDIHEKFASKKDTIWNIDEKDNLTDKQSRRNLFVVGDVVEATSNTIPVKKLKVKIVGITNDNVSYSEYSYDEEAFEDKIRTIPIDKFFQTKVELVEFVDLEEEQKNDVLGFCIVVNERIKILGQQNDKYWKAISLEDGASLVLDRSEFFVAGDIVKFTTKDKKYSYDCKILTIDPKYNVFWYLALDKNVEMNFDIGLFKENWKAEIIQEYNLAELFDKPILVPSNTIEATTKNILSEIEQAKKDLGQLLFMRNLISPIDFEQKIEVTQLIEEKQKLINELNFKSFEEKMSSDKFFDDLFEQSFTPIEHQYEDVYNNDEDIDFFAPNGQRSQLSVQLNEVIRTPQFKEWFGDWELAYLYKDADATELECSKVLNSNFEPRVVWHGTGQQFSYFIFDKFPAAYFAVNREYSQFFADLQGGGDGYVIPFFLDIRNPLDLTHFGTTLVSAKDFFDYMYLMTGLTMEQLDVNPLFLSGTTPLLETWVYIRNNPKMLKKIAETNIYDGIHFYESNPNVPDKTSLAHKTEAYITFSADQCKIADPNRGTLLFASLKSFLLQKGGKI